MENQLNFEFKCTYIYFLRVFFNIKYYSFNVPINKQYTAIKY